MPLLHAGAGALTETATQAWQRHSVAGARFGELERALQRAPPAQPSTILRFLLAELACVDSDRDPAHGAAAADVASVEALTALPAAPLSLSRAVALCMNAQGYVPAAALLQTYGGVAVASAAQTLAEDMQRDAAFPRSRRSRRGRRARRTRDDPRPRPGATDIASDDEHHSVPVCPDSAAARLARSCRVAGPGFRSPARRLVATTAGRTPCLPPSPGCAAHRPCCDRGKEAAPSMLQSETRRAVTSARGLDHLRPRPGNRGHLGRIDRPSAVPRNRAPRSARTCYTTSLTSRHT